MIWDVRRRKNLVKKICRITVDVLILYSNMPASGAYEDSPDALDSTVRETKGI